MITTWAPWLSVPELVSSYISFDYREGVGVIV